MKKAGRGRPNYVTDPAFVYFVVTVVEEGLEGQARAGMRLNVTEACRLAMLFEMIGPYGRSGSLTYQRRGSAKYRVTGPMTLANTYRKCLKWLAAHPESAVARAIDESRRAAGFLPRAGLPPEFLCD